jgi:hypothetical protein
MTVKERLKSGRVNVRNGGRTSRKLVLSSLSAAVRRQLLKRETNASSYFVNQSVEFEKWREKTERASMDKEEGDLFRLYSVLL